MTKDGKGIPSRLTSEESAEMRRQSDDWYRLVSQIVDDEASFLHEHYVELLDTGTTTIQEPSGTWTAILRRSRWRDGWLITEGNRIDRGWQSGKSRIARRGDNYLEAALIMRLATGLAWLRRDG